MPGFDGTGPSGNGFTAGKCRGQGPGYFNRQYTGQRFGKASCMYDGRRKFFGYSYAGTVPAKDFLMREKEQLLNRLEEIDKQLEI